MNIMRVISTLFLLLTSPLVLATNPSETRQPRKAISIDSLYEACSVVGQTAKGDIPFFDCESYVYGVLDGYLSIQSSIPKAKRACFPASLPPWRALEEVKEIMTESEWETNAGEVIIKALRKKYPCK